MLNITLIENTTHTTKRSERMTDDIINPQMLQIAGFCYVVFRVTKHIYIYRVYETDFPD